MYGFLSLNLECSCRIEARFDKLLGVDRTKREYFMDSSERTRSAMLRDLTFVPFSMLKRNDISSSTLLDESKTFRAYRIPEYQCQT